MDDGRRRKCGSANVVMGKRMNVDAKDIRLLLIVLRNAYGPMNSVLIWVQLFGRHAL